MMYKFIVYKLFFRVSNPRFFFDLKSKASQKKSLAKSPDKGISLLELIVATLIAAIIIQLAYFGFAANRAMYLEDSVKNDVNQDLSTLFEIIGPTITQAGQGIGNDPNFPVISISEYPNNTDNSQLTVRQLAITTKLPICRAVTAGAQTTIYFLDTIGTTRDADSDGVDDDDNGDGVADLFPLAGCDINDADSDNYPDNLAQWKNHRLSKGGTVEVSIYNGNGTLEKLNYTGETIYDSSNTAITGSPTAGQVALASITVTGNLGNDYNTGGANQLLIVERVDYRLENNVFQSILNEGTPVDMVNNIDQFTVTAKVEVTTIVNDAPVVTNHLCTILPAASSSADCDPQIPTGRSYNWSLIRSIDVEARPFIPPNAIGLSASKITAINNTSETQSFYPRNLLNFSDQF